MSLNSFLVQVAMQSSRTVKESMLKAYPDQEGLKAVFKAAYDPVANYYLNGERFTDCLNEALAEPEQRLSLHDELTHADGIFAALRSRQVTGNAAVEEVRRTLRFMSDGDRKLLIKILNRDLRCGATESTANKIWKDLIPEWPVLLAKPDKPENKKKIRFPAYVQEKCDGMRVNFVVREHEVEVRSRQGQIIPLGMEVPLVRWFMDQEDGMYDGELLVKDANLEYFEPREVGNGICNRAHKGTISKADAQRLCVVLWDWVSLEAFDARKCAITYDRRLAKLTSVIGEGNPRVALVKTITAQNWDEVYEFSNELIERGREGAIVKNINHIWEDRRSPDLVKLKAELDGDFRVVGWEEGTGRNKGRLGALVCQTEDGGVVFNVGTGFSDHERDINTAKAMIGKIVKITYNTVISNEKGGRSLFLPRWMGNETSIRLDKTKADVL